MMGQVIYFRRSMSGGENNAEMVFCWLDQIRENLMKGVIGDESVTNALCDTRPRHHLALVR